jgi:hypothetical protein
MGVLISKDGVIGGLDPNALKTLITFFLALPLLYRVEINISLFNGFFFFLLLTYKGACPKEKCLRVLVLGLCAHFNRELPLGNSLACCLE